MMRREKLMRTNIIQVYRHMNLLRHVDGHGISEPAAYVNPNLHGDYIPSSIYPERYYAYKCGVKIFFNFPSYQNAIPPLRNLSEVLSVAQELPYRTLLNMLRRNLTQYINCTSGYSSFIYELAGWMQTFKLSQVDVFNHGFVFEEAAAQFLDEYNWLKYDIFQRYNHAELTKMELADVVTTEKISSIIQHMDSFRSSIKLQFSNSLKSAIVTHRRAYHRLYRETLEFLLKFESYFATRETHYWDLARDLDLWRIPEAHVQAGNPVQFRYLKQEVWRTWPEYMNIFAFYMEQYANVLNDIDHHLFDVLSSSINYVDNQLTQFSNSIKNDLNTFVDNMAAFKRTTNLDSEFIL